MALVCDTLVVTATPNPRDFLQVGVLSNSLLWGSCFSSHLAFLGWGPMCTVSSRGSRNEMQDVSHVALRLTWRGVASASSAPLTPAVPML